MGVNEWFVLTGRLVAGKICLNLGLDLQVKLNFCTLHKANSEVLPFKFT